MSVTSGFFNSFNNDRRYNAEQMSAIFDGIINDGVFMNIGTTFGVLAATGNSVTVGIGKAWFNSSWISNDSILSIVMDQSEVLLDRIDAIVIEVNHGVDVRDCFIKKINGVPASTPVSPTMEDSEYVKQHPLAYITRTAGSTSIIQANIRNVVGTKECPFITGILKTADIDNLVIQWKSKWDVWTDEQKVSFEAWVNTLKNTLKGDVATSLAQQIYQTNAVVKVTLPVSGWTGDTAPYSQTVPISGADDKAEALMVSALEDGSSVDVQKAYMKALNIVLSGTASLGKNAYQPVVYNDSSLWEAGEYSSRSGNKVDSIKTIRLKSLLPVTPSSRHEFKITWTGSDTNTIIYKIRTYDASGVFIRNVASFPNDILTTTADERYLGVVLTDADNTIGSSGLLNAFDTGLLTFSIGHQIGSGTFKVYKKPLTDITIGLRGIGGTSFDRNTPILLDASGSIITDN